MLGMFCVWIWGVVPGLCSVDSLYSHEVCAGLHRLALIHSLRMATCDESHARSMASVNPVGGQGDSWASSPFPAPIRLPWGGKSCICAQKRWALQVRILWRCIFRSSCIVNAHPHPHSHSYMMTFTLTPLICTFISHTTCTHTITSILTFSLANKLSSLYDK